MTGDKTFTIGVDVGTYESKGVLVDSAGEILGSVTKLHQLEIPRPRWAEHDAENVWWRELKEITQELISNSQISAESVKAVGVSAIGPCVVPIDRDGQALRRAILYGIDTRATREIVDLTESHGEPLLLQRCGNTLTTQSIGPKILWIKRNEAEVYRSTYRFLTSTSYLVHKLTGNCVIDHYTAAGFTPLYDIHKQAWAPDLAEGIVEIERLGKITWTCEPAGLVTKRASIETGLAEGTMVIAGTADAAAEAVSAGVVMPGDMMLMYGSTLFMIKVQATSKWDARLWSAPFLFPGTHALMAGMATAGALTRWARDQFARELVAQEQDTGLNAYAQLAEEASSVPSGSDGVVILPYFSGERTPIQNPHAKGMVFGLTLSHTRAHIYRAILESIGYGIRHHLDVLSELQALPERLVAVGGGTKNALWLQLVSDITGQPQSVPRITIGASYGNAFLARLAHRGMWFAKELQSDLGWASIARVVSPSPEAYQVHGRGYRLYRALYEQTKQLLTS